LVSFNAPVQRRAAQPTVRCNRLLCAGACIDDPAGGGESDFGTVKIAIKCWSDYSNDLGAGLVVRILQRPAYWSQAAQV